MLTMFKRMFRIMHYGVLLFQMGGSRVFFFQLWRQIYSKDTLVGLEMDLEANAISVLSRMPYSLRQASEKDVEELLSRVKTDGRESAPELIQRRWFYESGFRDCYVARTIDTGELCFVAWLVFPKDDLVKLSFNNRLPTLKNGEVLLENSYTFKKYRGQNLFPSVVLELSELAKSRGFKRLITHVRKANIASIKGCEKMGFRKFQEVPEFKLLFSTRRKY